MSRVTSDITLLRAVSTQAVVSAVAFVAAIVMMAVLDVVLLGATLGVIALIGVRCAGGAAQERRAVACGTTYAETMNPAWVAVIGTAVGSLGATAAAFVAAWSGRQQASIQAAGQQDQWRRQLRRDTYGALLNAGAEARDELGSLFAELRRRWAEEDREWAATRLNETKPLINAVRLAATSVALEGPQSMLEPAKRVEEGLVLLHTAMLAIATRPVGATDDSVEYLAICGRERVGIRTALLDFASAARSVLDGDSDQRPDHNAAAVQDSAEELAWFLEGVDEIGGAPEIEPHADRTLGELGFESLSIIQLARYLRHRHGLVMEPSWLYRRYDRTLRQLADDVAVLRANGSGMGPADPLT
ncbi:phosphopantetheine-binding protein [Actinomadura sp. 6N118]|uniref:acyl carrier protein n=1 Tax=Actinomadura sp. 6N118 TaxID=3375151 RepID=UPI0037BA8C4C